MHEAWKPRPPEWVHLAPGVKWLLKPYTGDVQAVVQARVARAMAGFYQARSDFEDLGFDEDALGQLSDLNVIAGLGVYAAGVFAAELLLEGWSGFEDADTGLPIEPTPEAIRAALRYGTPENGNALLGPFMAWLDKPKQPIAAELRRLRALAKWEYGGGRTHCDGCALAAADCARGGTDGGDRCPLLENAPQTEPGLAALAATRSPGVWRHAGMGGQLAGLDYAAALAIAQADGVPDEGGFIRCLGAIEAGALEALAEKAKEDR